jgi:hypothetical protein
MKTFILSAIAAVSFALPSVAKCSLPESVGEYKNFTAQAQYRTEYKGSIYTLWEYRGYSPDGQIGALAPVITEEKRGRCTVSMDSRGDAPWAWKVPRPVAVAFARKEIEASIKRLGRAKLQALLSTPNAETINPEQAEAYKSLGFSLRPDQKVYPWIVHR